VEGNETVDVIATADSAVAGDAATAEGEDAPGFFDVFTEVSGSGSGEAGATAGPGAGRAGNQPADEEPSTLRDDTAGGSAGMEADVCDESTGVVDDDAEPELDGDLPV
jgi:hypothetical protein